VGSGPLFCLELDLGREPGHGVQDYRQVVESVRAIAEPIVRALSLELVDVECAGQGSRMVLRVFIDKPGGVTLSDCEQVHLSLGHALDVEDPIPHGYTLEVSSPGLDRPFKRREDYRRSLGKTVRLKLRHPYQGQWRVVGRLVNESENGVTVALLRAQPQQSIHLGWEAIAEGRLEVEF